MAGYIGTVPVPQAIQTHQTFIATASQTTFATLGYSPGFELVWLNGVKLVRNDDYTATNGSDIVLAVGAAADDVLEFLAFKTFEAANVYGPSNVIGVVSESGGVPTGAIIETGWDASKGTYTKYADGTLICRHSDSRAVVSLSGAGITWTFPVAFADMDYQVFSQVTALVGGSPWVTANIVKTDETQATSTAYDTRVVARSGTLEMDFIGIGRWF